MQALAGKVALVTGAGRHQGLGKAICAQLAADGCRIALTDLGEPKPLMEAGNIGTRATMDEVAAELSRIGPEVIALPMDVTDEAQIEAAIASVVARFGRLDILINNATTYTRQMHIYFQLHFTFTIMQHPKNKKKQKNKKTKNKKQKRVKTLFFI